MKRSTGRRALGWTLVCALGAGAAAGQKSLPSGPHAGAARVAKTTLFSDPSDSIGLSGIYTEGNSHCGGVAFVDYNGDFWPDLFVTNGTGLEHFLYRNEGDGTFTDVSWLVPKPDPMLPDAGVKFGDLDNDGDSDVLVVVDYDYTASQGSNEPDGGPNLLYVNQGDGTFVEGALAAGVVDPLGRRNICAGLADYDRDGWLDLYIANWQLNDYQAQNFDRLLHNDGDGTFTDVTAQYGLDGKGRDTLTCLWFDAQNDGWPDLYVGVAGAFNTPSQITDDIIYRNLSGVAFADVTGDPAILGNDAQAAMGMDAGDIDNDGDWDLYVTDIQSYPVSPLGNPLYLGDGQGSFIDNTADLAGVQANSSWPCNFADFDCDGWVDLYVGVMSTTVPDYLYLNDRDGTFTKTLFTPGWYTPKGGTIADYDGDGDVDVFFWNYRDFSRMVRNDSPANRSWLELKLIGTQSNRDAIGAVVRVTAGGITQMRRVSGGDSAHSQQDLIVHFGLDSETAAGVTIDWPAGPSQDLGTLSANQLVFVDETAGVLTEDLVAANATWSAANGLQVAARSSFGGRTHLAVRGYGDLTYVAAVTDHRGSFPAPGQPGTIEITSDRGGSWIVPVAP